MRCVLLLLAALLLLLSRDATAIDAPTSTPCAPTVSEGLVRARQALASTDPASQRTALACLTDVVSAMNDKIAALDQAVQHHGPHVNFFTEPVKVLGQ